jgi:acyl carrier protein
MNDVQTRLIRCFAAVFPELSSEEILRASPGSVGSWDSLASVTLLSVLEEEFQIQLALEDLEHLVSFDAALDYVRREKDVS